MKINKKEIIEELLFIEPGLKKNKKKLEKILDDFISAKPDIKISESFKQELKNNLLNELQKDKKNFYVKNSFINIKNTFSFILWWAIMYSVLWLMWFNFTNIDKINEINNMELGQVSDNGAQPNNTRMMDSPKVMMANIWLEWNPDTMDQEYYNQIKDILWELWFSPKQLEQIIEYIKNMN